MIIDRPGVYDRIPITEYVADRLCEQPTLSSGIVNCLLTKSPLHAKFAHPRLSPNYEPSNKTEFDLGTAAHEALLEGLDRVVVVPANDWRTNAAKEARDEARGKGLIPLLPKHYDPLKTMVETAKEYVEHSELSGIFNAGKPEQTLIWTEDDLWLRARPDWLSNYRGSRASQIVIHYKTTSGSAQPEAFIRGPLTNMGYDVTLAFYDRALGGDTLQVILAQECSPPYSCSLVSLAPAMADLAARKVDRAIRTWRACMKTDTWPSYTGRIAYAEPKPWQIAEEEEQEYHRPEIDPVQDREGITA